MSARIPEHIIAEIREKTDVVQIVGRYVQLRRTGANHKGLCPFHSEKTPSFIVNPDRQSYYCFGCHEKGDVIGFLMNIEGKSFMEVVGELADAAGVDLPKRELSQADQERETEREQLLRINKLAMAFFQEQLARPTGARAQKYLASRELEDRVVEAYCIGYAPDGWDGLTKHLANHRVDADKAVKLGLSILRRAQGDDAGARQGTVTPTRHYDFFRDRIMFPVLGAGGSVLGFSGRLLDPDAKERKYVNSPENPVYRKSETLYGLPVARPAMRRSDRAILVEGNVDVLGLYQAGFEDTVAPLGTALTDRQVSILRRFVKTVVLAYDGDAAGRQAARRAAAMLAAEDVMCLVALLPDGTDPADLAREQVELLGRLIANAVAGPAFLIDEVTRGMGTAVEERVRAAETLAPILGRIQNAVVRDEYLQRAAAAIGLRPEQIRQAVRGVQPSVTPTLAPAAKAPPDTDERRYALELLTLLVTHPHLAVAVGEKGVTAYLEDQTMRELLREAVRMQAATGQVDSNALLDRLAEEERDSVARRLDSHAFDGQGMDPSRALEETLGRVRSVWLDRELKRIEQSIKQAGERGDTEERRDLILRRQAVRLEKDELVKTVARGTRTGNQPTLG
ncbi:MAG: DNA primase [bacterium]